VTCKIAEVYCGIIIKNTIGESPVGHVLLFVRVPFHVFYSVSAYDHQVSTPEYANYPASASDVVDTITSKVPKDKQDKRSRGYGFCMSNYLTLRSGAPT
jgi:hypothetical protein